MIVETARAVLYCADVRDVLPCLQSELVISDPPYPLTSGGSNNRHAGGGWMAEYANDGRPVICDIDWPEIMKITRRLLDGPAGGVAYVMSNDRNLLPAMSAAQGSGFGLHNVLTWDKGNAAQSRWYRKTVEFAQFLYLGKARSINRPSTPSHRPLRLDRATDHPTEKPVDLFRTWIENSSRPGDLVIDPFMGTGAVGVAAVSCGRRFTGVDIDAGWFNVAVERIREAENRADCSR